MILDVFQSLANLPVLNEGFIAMVMTERLYTLNIFMNLYGVGSVQQFVALLHSIIFPTLDSNTWLNSVIYVSLSLSKKLLWPLTIFLMLVILVNKEIAEFAHWILLRNSLLGNLFSLTCLFCHTLNQIAISH